MPRELQDLILRARSAAATTKYHPRVWLDRSDLLALLDILEDLGRDLEALRISDLPYSYALPAPEPSHENHTTYSACTCGYVGQDIENHEHLD